MLHYSVDERVFEKFPGYVRGVVLAFGVTNRPSPPELVAALRAAEDSVRARLTAETVTTDPRIASWREAFRALGIKPNEFRASMEAMARRVLKNNALPSINALVDIGNTLSLKHLVPMGAHAIDVCKDDLALRFAHGGETFVPFGTDQVEHPDAGEIVMVEGDTVLTRRWSWRQANHTLTELTTKDLEINVEGMPPVARDEVEALCRELIAEIETYCGGRLGYKVLSAATPKISLSLD